MRLKHKISHHSECFGGSSVSCSSCQFHKERNTLVFFHGVPCASSYAVVHAWAYGREWIGMNLSKSQYVGAGENFRQAVLILRSKDRRHDFRNVPIPLRIAKLGNPSTLIEY